ncbi:MAG: N-acetylglucosamine-6-phosphate deacetylase [Selenomonas ruminantium]|uniref:N-acetylglucosamine-6-phosphate deacetylase n=1 Tax=Selenomonas ruminantium TaxID=971 RepID=A0A927ZPX2_SELRU|nr:N-acetylglucosamine-6-phosphate deacetylase [Selenomonas ruminantium]MBE6084524.1 N-acetylglucosamine-6-phosphate deacetylase [Selenomonas ruminantium]
MLAIQNGKFIVPNEAGDFVVRQEGVLLCEGENIKGFVAEGDLPKNAEVIDAQGNYVAPGFLNVHIHGCAGADTMDGTEEALARMARLQAQTGVTGFLPTTMTCRWHEVEDALATVMEAMESQPVGARVLGAHMEGPFISPAKKGAQAEENIRQADYKLVKPWEKVVKIITLAPEELPDYDFVDKCHAADITVSIGHTAADYDTAVNAVKDHGIHHFTHVYNAMTGFSHRAPGVVGAAFDTDANCEIIADNVHSHPAAQRLLYHAKGGKNIVLITDSLRACGLGDGPSELGGQEVFVKGELATLKDGTIAGSVATMNRCVKIFWENTGAELPQIIEMVTKTPAQELALYEEVGSLEIGKRADIVIFDEDVQIHKTVIGGKVYYHG